MAAVFTALALLLAVGCSTPPARRVAALGAEQLLLDLGERVSTEPLAVIGGLRELGAHGGLPTPRADEIEHELTFALHDQLRIVDHRAMEAALEVLRIEASDLYPDSDEGPSNIRRLGEFLKADLFVTGEYRVGAGDGLELSVKALDIRTLELIATAQASSVSGADRALDGVLYAGTLVTTPVFVIWDILVEVAETCFHEPEPHIGDVLLGWLMVPFYLPASPFLADYDTTRRWLDLEQQPAGSDALESEPPAELARQEQASRPALDSYR